MQMQGNVTGGHGFAARDQGRLVPPSRADKA
jgi:hypothetical protein